MRVILCHSTQKQEANAALKTVILLGHSKVHISELLYFGPAATFGSKLVCVYVCDLLKVEYLQNWIWGGGIEMGKTATWSY